MSWDQTLGLNYVIPPSILTLSHLDSGGSVAEFTLNSVGEESYKTAHQKHQQYLREFRQLSRRLELRPFDVRTLTSLADISYKCKEYECTVRVIIKLIKLNESTSDMLLTLAKCYVKRWIRDKAENDLVLALKTYKSATSIPDITQHPSPVPWFEMATVLLRLGRYQDVMNMFGLVLTLYKTDEYENWLLICQYNIAQVLLLSGEVQQAFDIYQELLLYNCDISVSAGPDSVVMFPLRIQHGVLLIEIARLTMILGKNKLAREVLRENWLSVNHSMKQGLSTVDAWLNDKEAMKNVALMFLTNKNYFMAGEFLGIAAELMSGNVDWDEIPFTTKNEIVELVLQRGELLAEVHSFAAAEYCAKFAVSRANGDFVVMTRAGKCCRPDQPGTIDIVNSANEIVRAVLRVQWALRSVFWRIKEKLKHSRIMKATKIVAFAKMCVTRNRLIADRLGHLSPIRMVAIATKLRKCCFSTGRKVIDDYLSIWNAASRMIQKLVGNWKRRRAWRVFWVGIQVFQRVVKGQCVRKVLREKVESAQRLLQLRQRNKDGGIGLNYSSFEKLADDIINDNDDDGKHINTEFSPQLSPTRRNPGKTSATKRVSISPEPLSTHPTTQTLLPEATPEPVDSLASGHTKEGISKNNSRVIRRSTFSILSTSCFPAFLHRAFPSSISVFTTASQVFTMEPSSSTMETDNNSTFLTSGALTDKSKPTSTLAAEYPNAKRFDELSTAQAISAGVPIRTASTNTDKQQSTAEGVTNNQQYPLPVLQAKPRLQRSIPPKILHESQSASALSPGSISKSIDGFHFHKSSTLMYAAKSSMQVPGVSGQHSFSRELALGPLQRNYDSNRQHLSNNDLLNPIFQAAAARRSGNRSNSYYTIPTTGDDAFLMESGPKGQFGMSWFSNRPMTLTSTQRAEQEFQQQQQPIRPMEELEQLLTRTAINGKETSRIAGISQGDILTQISIQGVRSAYSSSCVQWIPFSIIPDAEILRLLCCTILAITSPSFCVTDSKRLVRIAKMQKRTTNVWSRVKSLLVYGTRMGESGLLALMSLGIRQLNNLSLGYTNALTHTVISGVALQLMHASSCLVKLSIEGEPHCGDRGMVILLKHLQYNTSLKSLTLRDCGLSTRTATACARYIGVTQTLKYLNLNDNQFSVEDVLSIARAIASRGSRGSVDSIVIQDQFPPLTAVAIRSVQQYATALGIRVEANSDVIDVVYDTKLELNRPPWMDEDNRWNDNIANTVHQMTKDGNFLAQGLQTQFAKKLCL